MEVVEITPSRGWGSLVPLDRTTDHTPAEPAVKDASTPLLIPNFETTRWALRFGTQGLCSTSGLGPGPGHREQEWSRFDLVGLPGALAREA